MLSINDAPLGKTVSLLSFMLAYKHANPSVGKIIYCTRTVPEMSKCILELKKIVQYRKDYYMKNPVTSDQSSRSQDILAVCLSSRRNMCIHPNVMTEADGEAVDSKCRKMTASWVRSKAKSITARAETTNDDATATDNQLCSFYETWEEKGSNVVIPADVYSLDDIKILGKKNTWCPYFVTRQALQSADVIVYNYQYMLDPKVSSMVSNAFDKNSIVIFDEAHNIDNVCLEALSVELDRRSLDRASRNLTSISSKVNHLKSVDKARLDTEYRRLIDNLRSSAQVLNDQGQASDGRRDGSENLVQLGNPVLPDAILEEAIPGNIRKAEHFVAFMRRFVEYLRNRIKVRQVESESPQAFLHHLNQAISIDTKPMRYCYSRLGSLLRTLEITNLEEFNPIARVADFATLISSYSNGFMVLFEPFDSQYPDTPDPTLQLVCLDPSLAIQPVFKNFASVIITSGTLSPIDLYPKLLNFRPVVRESLPMSIYRDCICPLVVTRGSDQMSISTKFDLRDDMSVVRNYGSLLIEMAASCPDGMVCFFPSYRYMENIVNQWNTLGVLKRVLQHKLLFIETKDVVETTLALDNFKRACDCGRGGVFFSIARGKVAEGIDFDRHYGRCVIIYGIPFQYTLSHVLRARLEYLRQTHQILESDFLTFDALRQAAQCAGRVIRSKTDYGLILFADSRYNRYDKRTKLPPWIGQFLTESHLNLSVDMCVQISKKYLASMAQPAATGSIECSSSSPITASASPLSILLNEEQVQDLANRHKQQSSTPMQEN